MTFFEILDGLGDLAQGVAAVDNGRNCARFNELLQCREVFVDGYHGEVGELLSHKRRYQHCLENASDRSENMTTRVSTG